jgi:hypothetical protein
VNDGYVWVRVGVASFRPELHCTSDVLRLEVWEEEATKIVSSELTLCLHIVSLQRKGTSS